MPSESLNLTGLNHQSEPRTLSSPMPESCQGNIEAHGAREVYDLLRRLAHEFGTARGARVLQNGDGGATIAELDGTFAAHVLKERSLLDSDFAFAEELYRTSKTAQESALRNAMGTLRASTQAKLADLELGVLADWSEVGVRAARNPHDGTIIPLISAGRQKQRELAALIGPVLDPTVHLERLEILGLRQGFQLVLNADRAAIELKRATSWTHGDASTADRILERFDEHGQKLVFRIFQERYDTPLPDAWEAAFTTRLARMRNALHIPDLMAALRERYGVGAGLFELLRKWGGGGKKAFTDVLDILHSRLTKPNINKIRLLEQGDGLGLVVEDLYLVLSGARSDTEHLFDVLEKVKPQHLTELDRLFCAQHGEEFGCDSLREIISSKLTAEEQAYFDALLDGNTNRALALWLNFRLRTKRFSADDCANLATCDTEQLRAIRLQYESALDRPLNRDAISAYLSGALLDWMTYLFEGDELRAASARLECALHPKNTRSTEWIGGVFYGNTPERNEAIIALHTERYGPTFRSSLREYYCGAPWQFWMKVYGGERLEMIDALITRGMLTEEEFVRDCLIGFGADFEGVKKVLWGKSVGEIEDFDERYWNRFGGRSVRTDFSWEFSGHHRFDAEQMLKGAPQSLEERVERLRERLKHDLGTGDPRAFLSRLPDARTLAPFVAALEGFVQGELRARLDAVLAMEYGRFLTKRIENSLDSIREGRRALGDACANVGSLLGVIGATVLQIRGMAYEHVALICFGTTLTLRAALNSWIRGRGYGGHAIMFDVGMATIDGVFCMWGSAFRVAKSFLYTFSMRTVAKVATKTLSKHGVSSLWKRFNTIRSKHNEFFGRNEAAHSVSRKCGGDILTLLENACLAHAESDLEQVWNNTVP